jgi:regulator of cell morphogenesis and NO signaling
VTVRDPIERLLVEHGEIMREVIALRRAVEALDARGEAALPEAVPALAGVARMMATRLLAHAQREDEALFPAVEAVLGGEGGPTSLMREEHRAIHAEAARFRATLRELNEVEHPAIVSGGERLQRLAAHGGSAAELRACGAEILRLLDDHFGKEEQILFPLARQILSPDVLDEVDRKMESIQSA